MEGIDLGKEDKDVAVEKRVTRLLVGPLSFLLLGILVFMFDQGITIKIQPIDSGGCGFEILLVIQL